MIASVSVGTTQVQILPPTSGSPYKFVAFGNVGGETAYLKFTADSDSVTSQNGIPLPAGAAIICDQDARRELFDTGAFAITGEGSTTISVQAF